MSGSFKILVSGETIFVEFNYTLGQKPTVSHYPLNQGPFIVEVVEGPTVDDLTAYCTLQVIDPRKKK